MAARGEAQADVEVSTLVVPAWRLRWRAPELALVLGERASALATTRRDEADRLRAESLVVFAGNRLGRGVGLTDRALDALKAAEAAGEHESAWLLRVELAACARSAGAPLTGFAAVAPVLEAPDVPAELRASALVQASESLVTVGRGDEPARALAEADQLYVADTALDDDTRLVLRGLVRAVQAAQHRRWGDVTAAIGAAREGLDLLGRCEDPAADSGEGASRLTLELVLALLDANRLLEASEAGAAVLDSPVRASSAATTGWLRLALATRVHLPAGRVAQAREMLSEVAASAERHQVDTLLAESLLALAHVHEVSGELADALTNLRSAHAAERRRARAVYAVRARLAAEFSGVHRQPADLHQQLASLLRPVEGVLGGDGELPASLKQQLRQWRPVTVRKGEGVKANRVRRAAEDMTVEGLSAARQHAADRWRVVQPFGEPEDKTPEPVEPRPAPSSSDRTVPASGLIASAGAMVSGRRRAARVAAGEIGDDTPTTIAEIPVITDASEPPASLRRESPAERTLPAGTLPAGKLPAGKPPAAMSVVEQLVAERQAAEREAAEREAAERQAAEREAAERQAAERQAADREATAREATARDAAERQAADRETAEQPKLTPEQERRRKVEQQLMELQREARRQIEAERRALAEQMAQAEREAQAAEEAAREEAARAEAARQEAAREEAARAEAARQEAAREEAARQEAARQEAARQEAARQEAARQEAARQEAARQEAERQEAARAEAARQEAAREEAARQEAARREAAREEAARRAAARQQAERDATARLEAAREEVARQEAARREAARQEAVRRDVARQEAALQEVARLAAEREEAARAEASPAEGAQDKTTQTSPAEESRPGAAQPETSQAEGVRTEAETAQAGQSQPGQSQADERRSGKGQAGQPQAESVLDMLKAQGLRAGGRRRARDPLADSGAASGEPAAAPGTGTTASGGEPSIPSWRVEPPSRLRQDDSSAVPLAFSAAQASAASPDTGVPSLEPRPAPEQRSSPSGPGAADSVADPAPNLGPGFGGTHPDEPVYPLHTPAGGFPAADQDERNLPDLDFSSLGFDTPKREPDAVPGPEQGGSPERDLLSTSFLSPADVDDDPADVPTVPVQVTRAPGQPVTEGAADHAGPGTPSSSGTSPSFGSGPGFGAQSFGDHTFGTQSFGTQSFGDQSFGSQSFGTQGFGDQPGFGAQPAPAEQPPAEPVARPEPAPQAPVAGAEEEPGGRPSSRRLSEMSLADLLAEALVAYETGRRSDEDQVEGADLDVLERAAVDQEAAAVTPAPAVQADDAAHTVPPEAPRPGVPAAEPDLYFGASQFGGQPESDQEKTGPIRPVGGAPDNETTGPIRPVGFDGRPGWTLPGA